MAKAPADVPQEVNNSAMESNGQPETLSDEIPKAQQPGQDGDGRDLIRRVSRKVVPGLPRTKTFKRQQSEDRNKLEPLRTTQAERRAVSMDRRVPAPNGLPAQSDPRASAPYFFSHGFVQEPLEPSLPTSPIEGETISKDRHLERFEVEVEEADTDNELDDDDDGASSDAHSVHSATTSQYDAMIHEELERTWILNLSMHFRDKSKREKFFVTYREHEHHWRRVTVSLDYRNAPDSSLELDLAHTKFQRDKSAKIYEAIRESLPDIQFYDTVTNLKLETREGRLHVHVVEDVNEIINYPSTRMIRHMGCRRVKEREIQFDSHMSGFVYKVRVHGQVLIKKEIPGPDTVDEFLYEINALNSLRSSRNVIQFYGVVVDDREERVRGILISYAEQGALVDVLYDHDHSLDWAIREKWARQIVAGLSEIHEAGFVQGDFTLSNIVIDDQGNAKIIDINRRGCPVGWEPPEATPLIESNQRISMYIGVKSDLFQLGMVLWALATQDDEPEAQGRPLRIDADVEAPTWYCRIVEICLSENPRDRIQALHLLGLFPEPEEETGQASGSFAPANDNLHYAPIDYMSGNMEIPRANTPFVKTVRPPSAWTNNIYGNSTVEDDELYYPPRGRSPPRPIPGAGGQNFNTWSDIYSNPLDAPSISEITQSNVDESAYESRFREFEGDTGFNLANLMANLNHDPSRPRSAPPPETSQGRETPQQIRRNFGPIDANEEGTKNLDVDLTSPATDHTGKQSRADSGKDMSEGHHRHLPRHQGDPSPARHDSSHENEYTLAPPSDSATMGQLHDLNGIGVSFATGDNGSGEAHDRKLVLDTPGDEFGRELDIVLSSGSGSGLEVSKAEAVLG
ncbi:Traf2 and NCK-interacting protein kinase [Cladorrhinum sp. PSN259]|nr:Traf2 and NCK-interacting protein kinase [Cladorrhinum sp. PSN259]